MPFRTRFCPAFTLVEFLVVIAIVAVLTAMLIPSLAEAREAARAALCMANQRQIAIGFAGYLGDWKFTYPYSNPARIYPGPPADIADYFRNWSEEYTNPWTRNLGPYLGNYKKGDYPKVLLCPSNLWPAFAYNGQVNPATTYGVNDGVITSNWHGDNYSPIYLPTRERDLKRPSGNLLMGEVPLAASAYGRSFFNNVTSYLPFSADGPYTLPYPAGYWHAPDIAGRVINGNPIARVNHKLAWNSCMADGSVKRTTKATLFEYGNGWAYPQLRGEASMYWSNRYP